MISTSHVLGSFFFFLFLSSFSSTKIKTDAKSSGGKYVDTSTTMLINLGFFISGYEGVS